MMIKLKIFLFVNLFLISATLFATDERPEITDSSITLERWYQIELLIFRQKPASGTIKEIWPHEISLSYPSSWVRLKNQEEYIANPYPDSGLAAWLSQIKSSPYTPFVLQVDSEKSFTTLAKQIERLEGGVLFHGVWWQPFIQNDTRDPPAILIKAGRQYGDHAELEGSISFTLSRYLHISTNLWLSEFIAPVSDLSSDSLTHLSSWPPLPLPPDQPPLPESEVVAVDIAPSLQPVRPDAYIPSQIILIKQSRRMRSEETHYIDHPELGIIARITPQPEQ